MTKHILYTDAEALAEAGEGSTLYRYVAEGGLGVCKVCGCFEGSLATECPGEAVSADRQDAIYASQIDFIGGQWTQVIRKRDNSNRTIFGSASNCR